MSGGLERDQRNGACVFRPGGYRRTVSLSPMEMESDESRFISFSVSTLVSNWRAMPYSVSPDLTLYMPLEPDATTAAALGAALREASAEAGAIGTISVAPLRRRELGFRS